MVLDPKNTARTAKYQTRMKDQGLVKNCNWIPNKPKAKAEMQALARDLRRRYKMKLPTD